MKKLSVSLIVSVCLLISGSLRAAQPNQVKTEDAPSAEELLGQCAEEYTKLGEAYQMCTELVYQGDLFLKDLKENLYKHREQIDLLEQQLVAEKEKSDRADAWYNSKSLWTVIGIVIGGGIVSQIQK